MPAVDPFSITVTAVGVAAVLYGLTRYSRPRHRSWEARGITALGGWQRAVRAQATVGALVGCSVALTWGPAPGIAAAAFAWLATLAVLTDLRSYKIPWDSIPPVVAVGIVAGLSQFSTVNALSFVSSTVMVVLVPLTASLLAGRAIGMSDIRLLWAATATLSWWIGPIWMVYALIASCALQALARVVAPTLGWGRMVAKSASPSVSPLAGEGTVIAANPPRMRREMPFAPALIAGLLLVVVAASLTGEGSCAAWAATGTC